MNAKFVCFQCLAVLQLADVEPGENMPYAGYRRAGWRLSMAGRTFCPACAERIITRECGPAGKAGK